METLNLGDAIAELKVLRWRRETATEPKEREELIQRILEVINLIEIPELIGSVEKI
jgi:hypothetical protein|tara:strand:- start:459 stop:626 length:168 start_codon:yes stop_codon:yes gene_type:complete